MPVVNGMHSTIINEQEYLKKYEMQFEKPDTPVGVATIPYSGVYYLQ